MAQKPRKKARKPKYHPRVGSGLLATSVQWEDPKRPGCRGIFTTFWAYAFPCRRQCHAIVNVFGLPKGSSVVEVSIRKRQGRSRELLSMGVTVRGAEDGHTVAIPLPIKLTSAGHYDALVSLKGYPGELRLPFMVRTRGWPSLSRRERAYAKANAESLPRIQAHLGCSDCKHVYLLEATLTGRPPLSGALPFPDSGTFECGECGNKVPTRDMEGQMLSALRDQVRAKMKGKP